MVDHPGPSADQQVRASDKDRDRAAERLQAAAAEGQIELGELDQRLTEVYGAKTRAELERVGHDLPEPSRTDTLVVKDEPSSASR